MVTRIVGLLSFFDESPTWLQNTITSMNRFCDHVVVLDGRYDAYPDKRLQSGTQEHYAVIDAARSSGMGVSLHTAPYTFRDEMHKRSHLFKLGSVVAKPFEDWFFILDGDEVVVESLEKEQLVGQLERFESQGVDVVATTLWEKTDPQEDFQRTDLGRKILLDYQYETSTPRFWRVQNNMRVLGYHYNYIAENEDGVTVELWGMDNLVKNRVAWGSLCGKVIIENRNRIRNKRRDQDREAYYEIRDATKLETVESLDKLERIFWDYG